MAEASAAPQQRAGSPPEDSTFSLIRWWKRRYDRRPRTMHVPFEGRFLIGITLMVGFAAINTGNNLLFFGWGLMLASILISGILSEATLRALDVEVLSTGECRANLRSPLMIAVSVPGARLPAFGVASGATIEPPAWVRADEAARERIAPLTRAQRRERKKKAKAQGRPSDLPHGVIEAPARYQLKLNPQDRVEVAAQFVSPHRGVHIIQELFTKTAYPFGFFEKRRRYFQATEREVVVFPARVECGALPPTLLSRMGQTPTHQAGVGDEYFSMRPFRDGDDPRQIAWRVSARTGRAVVRENEVWATKELVLVCTPPDGSDPLKRLRAEAVIAATASIAEDLLQSEHAVGVVGPGVFVPPARGSRQRTAILFALAKATPGAQMGKGVLPKHVVPIGVTLLGVPGPKDVAHTITVPASIVDDVRPKETT